MCKHTPNNFLFVENPGKILGNLGKIPENLGKILANPENGAQRLHKNT